MIDVNAMMKSPLVRTTEYAGDDGHLYKVTVDTMAGGAGAAESLACAAALAITPVAAAATEAMARIEPALRQLLGADDKDLRIIRSIVAASLAKRLAAEWTKPARPAEPARPAKARRYNRRGLRKEVAEDLEALGIAMPAETTTPAPEPVSGGAAGSTPAPDGAAGSTTPAPEPVSGGAAETQGE